MKVTLFENCKIDRQGTDVIFPSPSVTEMGLLATATYTFENNKRFYLMGDSGVLDIELRDIPAYNCNYMSIEDNGKKYFMFIAGVEKYAGALYELVWELDVWHTEIDNVKFRNVMISAGHDAGQTRYLIYDNQDTVQTEPTLRSQIYGGSFGIYVVYATEFGYLSWTKPVINIKELNSICSADYHKVYDGTTVIAEYGITTKVSCLSAYLLPTEVINDITQDWFYTAEVSNTSNGHIPSVVGKCKAVTSSNTTAWTGKHKDYVNLNLDPTMNYTFGFKYNNIPLEWQWYRGSSSYSICLEYTATQQGIEVHLDVNGEYYNVTNWFEFTPNYSEEMRQFSAIKQANTLRCLTAGMVSPTWKSESTTTRSGGGWSNNRSRETDYSYTQRRNKKGQFTGKMMPEKTVLADTTNHIVAPSSSTVTSKITGMDLAVTGARMALNVGRAVVDKLITESLPRNFGGSTDINALINFSFPFGLYYTVKNDAKQIRDVISMYGYRTKEYFPSWIIDFSTWTEPFKYVQMDSVSLYGIYGDRVETISNQLYEGVRIYNGVAQYLGLNDVTPTTYDLTKSSNGESTIDTASEYVEPTFDEVVIKPWQKVYVTNASDFPSGGGDTPTPTPTPTSFKVYYQITGQSAVEWFTTDSDYTVYGELGQNDPFQQGSVTASHGASLESVPIPANKYVTAVTVDGATVNPTGTTYNATKYVYITLADKTTPQQTTRFKYNDTTSRGLQSLLDNCEFDVTGNGSGSWSVAYTGSGWNISVDGTVKWSISESYLGYNDLLLETVNSSNPTKSGTFNYGTDVTLTLAVQSLPLELIRVRPHNATSALQSNTELNVYCSTEMYEVQLLPPKNYSVKYDITEDGWVLLDENGVQVYVWYADDIQQCLYWQSPWLEISHVSIAGVFWHDFITTTTIPLVSGVGTKLLDLEYT